MTVSNRRGGGDRRVKNVPVQVERRSGMERRLESVTDQLQTVIEMIAQVADSATISDEDRRVLDTAVMRLRFATERMKP
jgi:hypothetical protein